MGIESINQTAKSSGFTCLPYLEPDGCLECFFYVLVMCVILEENEVAIAFHLELIVCTTTVTRVAVIWEF